MPPDPSRVQVLFRCALLLPAADRVAFLGPACRDAPDIRARVDELLTAHAEAGSFLADDTPLPAPPPERRDSGDGTRIGPYTLGRLLGEGGMGTVWAAEQDPPLRRTVALKVIKPGMDSRAVLARFEAERQALALMDHPNIAKVLDAGTTPHGRPFFAMELVAGRPITAHAAVARLSVQARLALFVSVCRAVQHAHQKGIIHRDLKPTNVLVAEVDGRPVPKVIDFGIAKAVEDAPAGPSTASAFGSVLGTLEYMAPEQAELVRPDVDTRADVYSLGALLYELLVGQPPLPPEAVRRVPLAEALRRVREDIPPRPSARLAALTPGALAAVADERGIDPGRLAALLRQELDWVVMKALEKDRERRYATAAELAADVQRYLDDEPVVARPPGRGYRVRKFVCRNRVAVAAAALVALALIGGTAAATTGLVIAKRAEGIAVTAREDEAEQRGRAEAQARAAAHAAAEARDASAATRDVLEYVRRHVISPGRPVGLRGGRGKDITLRQAVDAAVPSIGKDFAGRPLIEARVRHWVGQTYLALGELDLALEQLQLAAGLDEAHPPADPADAYAVVNDLAAVHLYAGRVSDAVGLLARTAPEAEARLGSDHLVTLAARLALGMAYDLDGRSAEAIAVLERVVPDYARVRGEAHPDMRFATSTLALALSRAGRSEEAEKLVPPDLDPDDPTALNALCVAASIHQRAGRPDRAVELYSKALPRCEALLGPDHLSTLEIAVALGAACVESGRAAEGVERLEAVRTRVEAVTGPDHPLALGAAVGLAKGYVQTRRTRQAAELLEQVLPKCREKVGPTHPDTLYAAVSLASAYNETGRHGRAATILAGVVPGFREVFGNRHPDTLAAESVLAIAFTATGRAADAVGLLEHVVAVRRETLGPDDPKTILAASNLGFAYHDAGRAWDALETLEWVLPRSTARFGPRDINTLTVKFVLSTALARFGRHDEAAAVRDELIPVVREKFGPGNHNALRLLLARAEGHAALGRRTDAVAAAADYLRAAREARVKDPRGLAAALAAAGQVLLSVGEFAVAEPLLRECLTTARAAGPDRRPVAAAESLLGAALLGQKKFAEAEPLLVSGYRGLTESGGDLSGAWTRPRDAARRIVDLYDEWGKPDEARVWRAELARATPQVAPAPRPAGR